MDREEIVNIYKELLKIETKKIRIEEESIFERKSENGTRRGELLTPSFISQVASNLERG